MKGRKYIIKTEEFCVLDHDKNERYFLKETNPTVHSEINGVLKKAAEIEQIDDIYPETFIRNTKRSIYEKANIPEFIPVEVISEYNNKYCVCQELFFNHKFIVPKNRFFGELDALSAAYLDSFLDDRVLGNIKSLFNYFYECINPPFLVRIRNRFIKRKDTK